MALQPRQCAGVREVEMQPQEARVGCFEVGRFERCVCGCGTGLEPRRGRVAFERARAAGGVDQVAADQPRRIGAIGCGRQFLGLAQASRAVCVGGVTWS
jgi:hypothetical protein